MNPFKSSSLPMLNEWDIKEEGLSFIIFYKEKGKHIIGDYIPIEESFFFFL